MTLIDQLIPTGANSTGQHPEAEHLLRSVGELAGGLLDAPIALIALTDATSSVQMWGRGASRLDEANCTLPFAHLENPSFRRLLIEDTQASEHDLQADLSAKTGTIRYVAGVPLPLPALPVRATLWVLDPAPHPEGSTPSKVLDRLATLATQSVQNWHATQARTRDLHAVIEAINTLPDSFFVFDQNGTLLQWNPELRNMTGYTDADIAGMHVLDFFDDAVQDRIAEAIDVVYEEGHTLVEAPITTRDGSRVPCEFSGSLLHDENGHVIGICGVGRDLTTRNETRQALRDSEERWRMLVDQHPAPIMITTEDEIAYVNASAAKILGGDSPAAIEERALSDFVTENHHAHLESRKAQLERGESTAPHRYHIRQLDGTTRLVEAFSAPITYNGQPAAQTVLRDVTDEEREAAELRHAKEAAEEMNRVKSTFLANMSHEIRTPLTSILGFSEVLTDKVDGEALDLVQLIHEGSIRLNETLNSVLDLAQLEGGSMQINFKTVDLAKRVQAAYQRFAPQAEHQGLSLAIELPDADAPARVDTTALDRVLDNLLSNALKFTSEGEIRLQVEAASEATLIRVEDTGVGIAPEFLPHLFDEFVQESEGLDREYEGAGLGLTITKRLMHLMRGTIEVESEKGAGTTFTLRFPLPTAPTTPAPAPQPASLPDPASETPAETPHHLLVVEDNNATRRLMKRMLDDDYAVDTAGTVDEALTHINDGAYDAILLDINLSERRTGVEVLHEVRAIPRYDAVPVIACTAYALQGHSQRFLDAGFTSVIAKPFTKRGLLDALTSAFDADPSSASDEAATEPVDNIELPPLPHTLPEIVNLISEDTEQPNTERLTKILRQDSVTSFWLLRHMNSAYYNLRRKISTVERAVTFLGFRPVCNLVLTEILTQHLTDADTPEVQRVHNYLLWTGLGTALYAKKLAARLHLRDPEVAYAGGMLSQLGRLLLLSRAPEQYAELWALPSEEDPQAIAPPPIGQEILHCGTDFITLGARAARAYNFSSELSTVIQTVHQPSETLEPVLQQLTLAAALGLRAAQTLHTEGDWTSFQDCRSAIEGPILSQLSKLSGLPSEELLFLIYDEKQDVVGFVETITRD